MIKLAATTSVFVNYSISDIIPIVANTGFDGIDIWGGRPHIYRKDHSLQELEDVKRKLEDFNLEVSSFMPAFFRYPHSLSSPNPTIRKDSVNYMCICADNAAILGAKLLLVVPSRSVHGQQQAEAFKYLVDSIHTVCEYCEQYDFKLGIEPANRSVTDLVVTHKDALRIVEQLNHPSLGVVMDTGHMYLNRENQDVVTEVLGNYLLQFHVNDNDGKQQQNAIPGDGSYDFKDFIQGLNNVAYNGFLSIELGWHYTLEPVEAIQTAYERITQIIKEVKTA